jgi:hypothetical protein
VKKEGSSKLSLKNQQQNIKRERERESERVAAYIHTRIKRSSKDCTRCTRVPLTSASASTVLAERHRLSKLDGVLGDPIIERGECGSSSVLGL